MGTRRFWSTTLLIPLECWRIVEQGAWRHAWVVVVNLAIVAYLFVHVRHRVSEDPHVVAA